MAKIRETLGVPSAAARSDVLITPFGEPRSKSSSHDQMLGSGLFRADFGLSPISGGIRFPPVEIGGC